MRVTSSHKITILKRHKSAKAQCEQDQAMGAWSFQLVIRRFSFAPVNELQRSCV